MVKDDKFNLVAHSFKITNHDAFMFRQYIITVQSMTLIFVFYCIHVLRAVLQNLKHSI